MKKIKVLVIFGTRPEAIKMAPLVKELKSRNEQFDCKVCVTAQHREMLDQVLAVFSIEPEYDLDIMQKKQTLTDITIRALKGIEEVILTEKPDMVLVHGDTSTTFVGSLAAFYQQVPVGHVEAGLRTWDKTSPYPEEMNRQLTGVLADLHFAPTIWAKDNLLQEGKDKERIFVTGNTVIDSFTTTVDKEYSHPLLLEKIKDKKMILVTSHRRENLGEPMENIFVAIRRLVEDNEEVEVVFPVHLNPVVQQTAERILGDHERINLINPLDVVDFHNFEVRANLILTDSGGLQEEAPSFGVPVLVLRNTTERPEGIKAGTLKLVGTDSEEIYKTAHELLNNPEEYNKMAKAANPYGDGKGSKRIADIILHHFGYSSEQVSEFEA